VTNFEREEGGRARVQLTLRGRSSRHRAFAVRTFRLVAANASAVTIAAHRMFRITSGKCPRHALLIFGPITWLLFGFVMIKGRKRMRILVRPAPPAPQPPPKISILIPAKDEAERIESCLHRCWRKIIRTSS
jgi:hypothetical protein